MIGTPPPADDSGEDPVKLGVPSDTHDNLPNPHRAVAAFAEAGVAVLPGGGA